MSEGELFIVGRIKDLLIVDGRNHYPDDIEATIQEITGGRVAAISIPDDRTEQLVAIVELKKRGIPTRMSCTGCSTVKREVASAISKSHSVRVADLVLVPPGSIPITTSGKVRRVGLRRNATGRTNSPGWTCSYDGEAWRRSRTSTLAGRLPGHDVGCSPDDDRPGSVAERAGSRVARRGRALR